MSDFEEENPFQQSEGDEVPSSENASNIDLSEPSTPPTHPSRILSSPTFTTADRRYSSTDINHKQTSANVKSDFCCGRDRWLHSGEDVEIIITDAQKTSENSSSPYIVYVFKAGTATAYHRYSEFESLRNNLSKLYPTLIIPPIPSKQTISDYAIKQAKAKEDANMIARRKRMLQTFLNRIAKHPVLSSEHVFHRFLDGEVSWTEILHSPPLSNLPKNILKASPRNPTDNSVILTYAALPNPSSTHPLRRPDQRFLDSEAFTNKFASHMNGPMEKVTRRIVKRWAELAQDHADLGAVLNGFSLNESGALSSALEKTGQAIDATYISTTKLLQEIEQNYVEPLHEYCQYANIIKKLLVYRHQKHAQFEITQEALETKKEQLEELEKSEREAKRLEEALDRGRASGPSYRHPVSEGEEGSNGEEHRENARQEEETPVFTPPHPVPAPTKRRGSSLGLLHAISYTIHGMMDVDPETARRNGISKTRETISQLEDALHLSAIDAKYANTSIQADLDRFQRQKVADLREMALSMARSHRDWCKRNLEAWEDVKKEISQIPDHPNHVTDDTPPSETSAGTSSNRGDSTSAGK